MKRHIAAVFILVLLTSATYCNSFNAGFHFDDYSQIVGNQNINTLSDVSRFFTSAEVGTHLVGIKGYRPLTILSFAINYALSGYNVLGYHVFNLLVHALNVVMVYALVLAVLRRTGRDGYFPALVTALLFAVHPIQTNSVTYISERAGMMAGGFTLAALLLLHLFRTSGKYVYAGLSVSAFSLGLLSKETAVVFIPLAAAYDFIFTLPEARNGKSSVAAAALFYIPLGLALAGFLLVRKTVMGHYVYSAYAYDTMTYLVSEAKVLLLYLRLLVLPVNQNADYAMPAAGHIDLAAAVSAVLVVSAVVFLARSRKTIPAAAFFGIWFFVAIAPESSIFPIADIAVEYRLYLPSVGFIAFFVIMAGECVKSSNFKRVAVTAVVIAFVSLSLHRNIVWATDTSLWKDVAAKAPASTRAHVNLGAAFLREGVYKDASDEFNTALQMDPDPYMRSFIYNELASCYSLMGTPGEAVSPLLEAVRLRPGYKEAYANLGAVYRELGRYDESVTALEQALSIEPAYVLARYNLGKTYLKAGRPKEALREMELAFSLAPRDFNISYNLAIIYSENKMTEKAVEQAKTAGSLASNAAQESDARALFDRLTGQDAR